MSTIKDIADALGAKFHDGLMDEHKPKAPAPAAPREYSTGARSSEVYRPAPTTSGGPKIFPSDRMALRDGKPAATVRPRRAAVLISTFTDADLEWMLATPAKRGWQFADWLEVIGLPRDLHEQHDAGIYGYAARAFLKHKQAAHQR